MIKRQEQRNEWKNVWKNEWKTGYIAGMNIEDYKLPKDNCEKNQEAVQYKQGFGDLKEAWRGPRDTTIPFASCQEGGWSKSSLPSWVIKPTSLGQEIRITHTLQHYSIKLL